MLATVVTATQLLVSLRALILCSHTFKEYGSSTVHIYRSLGKA